MVEPETSSIVRARPVRRDGASGTGSATGAALAGALRWPKVISGGGSESAGGTFAGGGGGSACAVVIGGAGWPGAGGVGTRVAAGGCGSGSAAPASAGRQTTRRV